MKARKHSVPAAARSIRAELAALKARAHDLEHAAHDLHERVSESHHRAHTIPEVERPALHKPAPAKEVNWTFPE